MKINFINTAYFREYEGDSFCCWIRFESKKSTSEKKEIEAFVADRLLEAIWRESLWLIKDGITTTEELDDIVRFGFGLRYAQMGVFETYRIAGGEAGMRHFLAQFGPCLTWFATSRTRRGARPAGTQLNARV